MIHTETQFIDLCDMYQRGLGSEEEEIPFQFEFLVVISQMKQVNGLLRLFLNKTPLKSWNFDFVFFVLILKFELYSQQLQSKNFNLVFEFDFIHETSTLYLRYSRHFSFSPNSGFWN